MYARLLLIQEKVGTNEVQIKIFRRQTYFNTPIISPNLFTVADWDICRMHCLPNKRENNEHENKWAIGEN